MSKQPATAKQANVTSQLDALFDQVGADALCLPWCFVARFHVQEPASFSDNKKWPSYRLCGRSSRYRSTGSAAFVWARAFGSPPKRVAWGSRRRHALTYSTRAIRRGPLQRLCREQYELGEFGGASKT
jgi:hypothetical protein